MAARGGGGRQPLASTSASQTASLARVTARRVEVTSVQLHTRLSNENVLLVRSGTTSGHGTAYRTKSYTAAPPGAELSSHPCRSSTSTRTALRSHTLARTPVFFVPTKYTPEAPARTSSASIGNARSSAATTSSSPGWHVA